MKYLLVFLFAVVSITAQNTPPHPMKKLVVGGNRSVTLGQVVAGYSNNFHVGIRPPYRGTSTSVEETIQMMNRLVYPNPSYDGNVNIQTENLKSIQVVDLFGTNIFSFHNLIGSTDVKTFQLNNRGIYFVNMVSNTGSNHSTILIFQ